MSDHGHARHRLRLPCLTPGTAPGLPCLGYPALCTLGYPGLTDYPALCTPGYPGLTDYPAPGVPCLLLDYPDLADYPALLLLVYPGGGVQAVPGPGSPPPCTLGSPASHPHLS